MCQVWAWTTSQPTSASSPPTVWSKCAPYLACASLANLPSWCDILYLPSHPRHYSPLRFFHDLHDHQRLQYSLHLEKPKSCGYSALSVRQIHGSIEQFHSVCMQEHKSNLALDRVHYKIWRTLIIKMTRFSFSHCEKWSIAKLSAWF